MAYIKPKRKTESPYIYIVKGAFYRIKVKVYNYPEHECDWVNEDNDVVIHCHALEQSYHKNTAYTIAGDLIYNGISLKEAWEEIQSYVGPTEMPKELKELQPFITQQI